MTSESREDVRVPRYGPKEIGLRHQMDRLSLLVSAARDLVQPGTLGFTVVRATYPAILDGINAMDRARADAKRWRGRMTESCLALNEGEAKLLSLWADCCSDILRPVVERAA